MTRQYYIYILASDSGTLYIGITGNLNKRLYEHRNKVVPGFTQKYNCYKLVYFEEYDDVKEALAREKQLKKWNRDKKEVLIRSLNPHWNELLR